MPGNSSKLRGLTSTRRELVLEVDKLLYTQSMISFVERLECAIVLLFVTVNV